MASNFLTSRITNSIEKIIIPTKTYLRKTSRLYLCVNNEELAIEVQKKIANLLNNKNNFIFEACPGKGILTKQFLEHGITKIRVFENSEKKIENLRPLLDKYSDRLQIIDKQILGKL